MKQRSKYNFKYNKCDDLCDKSLNEKIPAVRLCNDTLTSVNFRETFAPRTITVRHSTRIKLEFCVTVKNLSFFFLSNFNRFTM